MVALEGDRARHAAHHGFVAVVRVRVVEHALAREVLAEERGRDDLEEPLAQRTRQLQRHAPALELQRARRRADLDLARRELRRAVKDNGGLLAQRELRARRLGALAQRTDNRTKRIIAPFDGIHPARRARLEHLHLPLHAHAAHQGIERLLRLRRSRGRNLIGGLPGLGLFLRKDGHKGGERGDGRRGNRCLE